MTKDIVFKPEECLGCRACENACALKRSSTSGKLFVAVAEAIAPEPRVRVVGTSEVSFPLQCRHCTEAACLSACPAGAMQRDKETGKIFVQEEKCIGCWMCVMVCPVGAVKRSSRQVALKCDACYAMERPACVQACPTKALKVGDMEAPEHAELAERLVGNGRVRGAYQRLLNPLSGSRDDL